MNIPSYRYVDSDLVLVNPEVGTGFIGLEKKHIDVVTEGSGIANVSNITTGNIIFAKDPKRSSLTTVDSANANNTIYSGIGNVTSSVDFANSTITFDTGSENIAFTELANADGGYNGYVWTEGGSTDGSVTASTNSYYHKKLLPISANSVANTFTVTLPSNSWSTGRSVTAAVDSSNTVTLTANVEGLRNGDNVTFIGNTTLVPGSPYTVASVNSGSGTFTITEAALTGGITSGLDFVNVGQTGTANIIQVFSAEHGYVSNTTTGIIVTGSSNTTLINNANFSLADTSNITNNTFFIQSNAAVDANVTGNFNPNVSNLTTADGLTIKPAYLLNTSNQTTLNGIMSLVNGKINGSHLI